MTKLIATLVIAALMLTGVVALPDEPVSDAPAIAQATAPAEAAAENAARQTTPPTQATEAPIPETVPEVTELTREEAIAIALKHAGLTESQVTGLRAEYDRERAEAEWDVEFRSGNYEYDYEIHAVTGQILRQDKEYDRPEKEAAATQPPATEPKPTEPASKRLNQDQAVQIALEHAGLTAGQVTRLRAEFDMDDGVPEWDVEFRSGNMEYEYTIHAETGKILEWDKDRDD